MDNSISKEPLNKSALPKSYRIWYNNIIKTMVVQAMKQETFTDIEYRCRKKKTKREEYLEIMDEIIPWDEWVSVIRPCYPMGKRGRPPMGHLKACREVFQGYLKRGYPLKVKLLYRSFCSYHKRLF